MSDSILDRITPHLEHGAPCLEVAFDFADGTALAGPASLRLAERCGYRLLNDPYSGNTLFVHNSLFANKARIVIDDAPIRSGRTTRLIEDALRLAQVDHRAVYVVADNEYHAHMIREQIEEMNTRHRGMPHGIKVEVIDRFPELDPLTMKLRRGHPNCVVLVDHFAIESRLHRAIEMMHRYDPKRLVVS